MARDRRSCCAGLSLTAAGHPPDLVVLEGERRSSGWLEELRRHCSSSSAKTSIISWVEIVLAVLHFMTQDGIVGARKLISKI